MFCSTTSAASNIKWMSNESVMSELKLNKLVRPRWPYDMRPSVRAEKYMCVIVIR